MGRRATIAAALALAVTASMTSVAQAAPARTVALGGGALTASWDATGSGVLLTSNAMDAVGCEPGVHDCDDTLIQVLESGTLTVTTSSDDPAAVDADLELYSSNADGEVGELLEESAGTTAAESASTAVSKDGYYLARIEYAASAQGAVHADAELKPKPEPDPDPEPGEGPIDYTKIGGLSQPVFTEVERTSTEVPGVDGVNLYIEVIKPKAEGRYPVILESSGYHGTLYKRDGIRILPLPKGEDGQPLGLAGYFPPRGYAVVMMDLRGTGKSEGCLDHLGQNDFSDIKTVIDWAAKQPWSNGRVGMTGHSYVGGTTNVGGATHAKGLKTIVPSASLASMYDHQFQGGVPFNLQWAGPIEAYEQLALQADLPPQLSPVTEAAGNGPTGDNFGNDPEYTGCGLPNSAIVAGPDQFSGQFNWQYHGPRDHRDAVQNAKIPIFLQHGTIDAAARIGGVEWFFKRRIRKGDKMWIGQWGHGIGCCPTRRGLQWTYALHAWFDKQLAQRPVETGPPVEVFLNDESTDAEAELGQGSVLTDSAMPRTRQFVLHASADGGLARTAGAPGSASFTGDPLGYLANADTGGVSFESDPFKQDKVFFGLPQLALSASVTVPRVYLIGTLFAVDDDGRSRRLTQCSLNPELRNGLDKQAPVVPFTTYSMTPPCFAMAYQVRAGQRLRLRVTTSDPDKVPMFSVDPNITVAFGGANDTRITLPEVLGGTLIPDTLDLGDTGGDPDAGG